TREEEAQRHENAAIGALRERMRVLRDEGTRFAASLQTGQQDAAEAWSTAITDLEQRMLEAINRVTEVDRHALESARAHLASLSEEARRVDESIAERSGNFHQQFML